MLTEVAPGVFGVDHRVAAGKNGIVSGERAALAIDTGHYPDERQAMADFIRARERARVAGVAARSVHSRR